jgi:hypothetical protein
LFTTIAGTFSKQFHLYGTHPQILVTEKAFIKDEKSCQCSANSLSPVKIAHCKT